MVAAVAGCVAWHGRKHTRHVMVGMPLMWARYEVFLPRSFTRSSYAVFLRGLRGVFEALDRGPGRLGGDAVAGPGRGAQRAEAVDTLSGAI
jgi:hypothetical protein